MVRGAEPGGFNCQLPPTSGGGGGNWPIQEGSTREGYVFEDLGIQKGRDFCSWKYIYERVGKSVIWVGEIVEKTVLVL